MLFRIGFVLILVSILLGNINLQFQGRLLPEWLKVDSVSDEIRNFIPKDLYEDLTMCIDFGYEHKGFIDYCISISKWFLLQNKCQKNVSIGCRLSVYYLDKYMNNMSYHNLISRFSSFTVNFMNIDQMLPVANSVNSLLSISTKHQLSKLKMLGIHNPWICFMIIILLLLAILYEVAVYNIGLITGDYYKILIQKDYQAFLNQTAKSIGFIIAISLLKSIKDYVASYLYVEWRRCLTTILHENYFINLSFYRINVFAENTNTEPQAQQEYVQLEPNEQNAINNSLVIHPKKKYNDNVDQRITQDVDKMFSALSQLMPEILVSPFIMAFYWYKCQKATGWIGPIGCLALFSVGSIINYFLIRCVSKMVYAQERSEGDFRYQHLRIRNNAEAIAFISGESMEKHKCQQFLEVLISTQKALIFRQFWLKFSTNLSDYFGAIISFLALAVPLFAGKYDNLKPDDLSKLISQNSFFIMYLINCFTRLIDLSTNLSTFLGTYSRISELSLSLERNNQSEQNSEISFNQVSFDDANSNEDCFFDIKNVTIRTPTKKPSDSRIIVNNLNLQIKPRINLVITGPSGVGKTSIFRCLKQIWPIAQGNIKRNLRMNDPTSVMFLSHQPVLTTGSIAEQIIYPKIYQKEEWLEQDDFCNIVLDILIFLDLEIPLLKRVNYDIHRDLNENWLDHLSAGEVQRFNMARLFYHRPSLVFLDECTNALPEEQEARIFEELVNRHNMTIVSCSHRESWKNLHKMELSLDYNSFQILFKDKTL